LARPGSLGQATPCEPARTGWSLARRGANWLPRPASSVRLPKTEDCETASDFRLGRSRSHETLTSGGMRCAPLRAVDRPQSPRISRSAPNDLTDFDCQPSPVTGERRSSGSPPASPARWDCPERPHQRCPPAVAGRVERQSSGRGPAPNAGSAPVRWRHQGDTRRIPVAAVPLPGHGEAVSGSAESRGSAVADGWRSVG
jgi:hypothetical protein